ncbi:hypothetical protein Y032_0020g27 [Ancylostoma ceylanicum]|uniref:Protein quiver n=1 Tax=Ancylostoma ceylanicum TaxID=53326 RepID=A0A016V1M7_9BILA|nr:hypothetical protein Y032_0020g27 [Ancylostoma ceylanicum]
MAAFAVFVLLLSLYSSINADFIRCYDGTDEYKVVEADNPICAFTVRYPDDKCTKKATVYKGKSDLTKHEGKATCYYSFKRTAIICHCHGDLCNTDANIIKILTMELAKGAPKSMKKVVNCFLSQNDAKPTSDPVEDDPKLSPQSAKQLENERQGVLGSGKLMKKGHISSGKLHGQHKAKRS